jgi:hypothetical protein
LAGEPENLDLELLRGIRADVARADRKIDAAKDELRAEMMPLRADIAADLVQMSGRIASFRKETGEQIAGLRRAVVDYHSAVLGHGVLIGDLETRVRRLEKHAGMSEMGAE